MGLKRNSIVFGRETAFVSKEKEKKTEKDFKLGKKGVKTGDFRALCQEIYRKRE